MVVYYIHGLLRSFNSRRGWRCQDRCLTSLSRSWSHCFKKSPMVLLEKLNFKLLNKAEVVHAVSRREASMLKSHYPETSRKTIVVSNGVEEDVL